MVFGRGADDPTPALLAAEEYMDKLDTVDLQVSFGCNSP
jgi:hypothetical protein